MVQQPSFDIFIIGGGINGCGIARDAAGRGYSVGLAEMVDLGSGTSSGSTKLIHGGLRYLEHYEFRLVREALEERELLWAMAPHIVWPLRFVLPHHKGLRPYWMVRLGLFLYDHLGGRKLLPGTRVVDMKTDAVAKALKSDYAKGFEYSDCWVDDARLVVLNAMDAAQKGADIRVGTKVISAQRLDGIWSITLENDQGVQETVSARILVNAAGPWVDHVLSGSLKKKEAKNVRLVQGSHIVVPKLFDHDHCYILQNKDGRITFAIPYEQAYTLIGTTDSDYQGDPRHSKASAAEIDYMCQAVSSYFNAQVQPEDVVWSYAAVRPLYDDGASKAQEATRDYVIKAEGEPGQAQLINLFGGKITTYRRLAESALSTIEEKIGRKKGRWTANSTLPGGDFAAMDYERQVQFLKDRFGFLNLKTAQRYIRLYGTLSEKILNRATCVEDLGICFGSDLYEAEVRYLIDNEWARSAEDVLWRRTKMGLRLTKEERNGLLRFFEGNNKIQTPPMASGE